MPVTLIRPVSQDDEATSQPVDRHFLPESALRPNYPGKEQSLTLDDDKRPSRKTGNVFSRRIQIGYCLGPTSVRQIVMNKRVR
ncbi:MAG: hypothetical protein CM1200mP20_13360 [Pseudomonadota bacterium]|nr:MAG: hypothetical protein CM1200mP20_13360 [Pseudomonadota bacterium]